ncbi:hypothetical protein [Taklimakanibacter deserti]|uniref:hypothetical protein n=1 Tax=Taklimakanibacter deserti TaxID=2267839 RepID=UPI000E65BC43
MTSTPCQSAAFDRIVVSWAAKIAEFFAVIVETILTIAENVHDTLHELSTSCWRAGPRLPALRPVLSRPMMPKLGFLLPSASVRHSFARERSPELNDAVRCVLTAAIGAALARITGNRRIDLDVSLVSLSAWMRETRQVAAIGDAEEELMISKILRQRILKGYWKREACMSPRKQPVRFCARS